MKLCESCLLITHRCWRL